MTIKSKWRRLTPADLKTCLAQDELDKLKDISVEDLDDVLQA